MGSTESKHREAAFWKRRRVLIAGHTGFVGSWLANALLRLGADVTGLARSARDRPAAAAPSAAGAPGAAGDSLPAGKLEQICGSVSDLPLLGETISGREIDTVFHLAAQPIVETAMSDPLATFETNVRGTWNLLEACRRCRSVTRVVIASTDSAFALSAPGEDDGAHPPPAGTPYDTSKLCAESIAATYQRTYGTPVCIARCGNLFGGGDRNLSRIVPATIRSVLGGEPPVIRSDGSPVRDYVHVEDLVLGLLLLARRVEEPGIRGGVLHFLSGTPLSVLEITNLILKVMDRVELEPRILNEGNPEPPYQPRTSRLARQILGWEPASPIERRLEETVRWYSERFSPDGTFRP